MEFEYVINRYTPQFAFNDREYVIRFGGVKKAYDKTPSDVLLEYTSDSITHEHIHKAIFDLFGNKTLCKLFDVVQQHFRNTKITKKIFKKSGYTAWDKFINKFGFYEFLEDYHITRELLYESFECSNERV